MNMKTLANLNSIMQAFESIIEWKPNPVHIRLQCYDGSWWYCQIKTDEKILFDAVLDETEQVEAMIEWLKTQPTNAPKDTTL